MLELNVFAQQNNIDTKRALEQAGAVYLLNKILNTNNTQINYTAQRKPFLENRNEHISISHSHNKLAIIVNTKENTGIDIELVRDKIKQIEHKFLNDQEKILANGEVDTLIKFWAAKETLYKIYGLKEIEFIGNLYIESFKQNELIAGINTPQLQKKYRLASQTIQDYQLVFALNEI